MGWMRALFLGDIGNQLDIEDTRRDLDGIRHSLRQDDLHKRARDAEQDECIVAMQEEIEELQMLTASLTRLLVSRGVIAESDAAALVGKFEP